MSLNKSEETQNFINLAAQGGEALEDYFARENPGTEQVEDAINLGISKSNWGAVHNLCEIQDLTTSSESLEVLIDKRLRFCLNRNLCGQSYIDDTWSLIGYLTKANKLSRSKVDALLMVAADRFSYQDMQKLCALPEDIAPTRQGVEAVLLKHFRMSEVVRCITGLNTINKPSKKTISEVLSRLLKVINDPQCFPSAILKFWKDVLSLCSLTTNNLDRSEIETVLENVIRCIERWSLSVDTESIRTLNYIMLPIFSLDAIAPSQQFMQDLLLQCPSSKSFEYIYYQLNTKKWLSQEYLIKVLNALEKDSGFAEKSAETWKKIMYLCKSSVNSCLIDQCYIESVLKLAPTQLHNTQYQQATRLDNIRTLCKLSPPYTPRQEIVGEVLRACYNDIAIVGLLCELTTENKPSKDDKAATARLAVQYGCNDVAQYFSKEIVEEASSEEVRPTISTTEEPKKEDDNKVDDKEMDHPKEVTYVRVNSIFSTPKYLENVGNFLWYYPIFNLTPSTRSKAFVEQVKAIYYGTLDKNIKVAKIIEAVDVFIQVSLPRPPVNYLVKTSTLQLLADKGVLIEEQKKCFQFSPDPQIITLPMKDMDEATRVQCLIRQWKQCIKRPSPESKQLIADLIDGNNYYKAISTFVQNLKLPEKSETLKFLKHYDLMNLDPLSLSCQSTNLS